MLVDRLASNLLTWAVCIYKLLISPIVSEGALGWTKDAILPINEIAPPLPYLPNGMQRLGDAKNLDSERILNSERSGTPRSRRL